MWRHITSVYVRLATSMLVPTVHKCIAGIERKCFFTSLCTNTGSYSDMACILWLYMCWNHYLRSCTAMWKKNAFSQWSRLCTPTWWLRHRRIWKVNGAASGLYGKCNRMSSISGNVVITYRSPKMFQLLWFLICCHLTTIWQLKGYILQGTRHVQRSLHLAPIIYGSSNKRHGSIVLAANAYCANLVQYTVLYTTEASAL